MGKLGRFAVCGAVLVSCSGSNKTPEKPAGATSKTYAPLAAKTDAKLPNQAVILGTDESNGSTVLPLPAAPSKGLVDAMFVKLGGKEKPSGGTSPVKLGTAPNSDGSVQVGIFEEMSGGTGPQWRAN